MIKKTILFFLFFLFLIPVSYSKELTVLAGLEKTPLYESPFNKSKIVKYIKKNTCIKIFSKNEYSNDSKELNNYFFYKTEENTWVYGADVIFDNDFITSYYLKGNNLFFLDIYQKKVNNSVKFQYISYFTSKLVSGEDKQKGSFNNQEIDFKEFDYKDETSFYVVKNIGVLENGTLFIKSVSNYIDHQETEVKTYNQLGILIDEVKAPNIVIREKLPFYIIVNKQTELNNASNAIAEIQIRSDYGKNLSTIEMKSIQKENVITKCDLTNTGVILLYHSSVSQSQNSENENIIDIENVNLSLMTKKGRIIKIEALPLSSNQTQGWGLVNTECNLFPSRDMNTDQIAKLSEGQVVKILAQKDDWYFVNYQNRINAWLQISNIVYYFNEQDLFQNLSDTIIYKAKMLLNRIIKYRKNNLLDNKNSLNELRELENEHYYKLLPSFFISYYLSLEVDEKAILLNIVKALDIDDCETIFNFLNKQYKETKNDLEKQILQDFIYNN